MSAPGAQFELEGGRLHITWAELARYLDVVVRCRLDNGDEHDSAGWQGSEGRMQTTCGPLDATLELHTEGDRIRAHVSVVAREKASVRELGLAGRVLLKGVVPQLFVHNGYGSWDASGLKRIEQQGAALESSWSCAVADESGAGVAASATTAERTLTEFLLHGSELAAVQKEADDAAGTQPLLWDAEPGESWEMEDLFLAASTDVRKALERVAEGPIGEAPMPRGWLSWYHYGPWVEAENVLANAAELKNGQFGAHALKWIQIDDGWQRSWGDWQPNSKFGGDFTNLIGQLKATGFKPGIWLAPFLVGPDSDLSGKAPEEWFLRDPKSGRRLADPREEHLRTFYVLDARNPEVREHLRTTFATLREQGFEYFKIDFIYAGAYAGIKALREGVKAIREGIGAAYLLASGAPLLPMVGLADGCRVGIDTCSMLFDFEKGQPLAAYVDDEIRSIARNVAWRQHLRRWFQLDPDVALAGGNSSLEEARQLITLVAISGGLFFLSDDLPTLDRERRRLLTNEAVLQLAATRPATPAWEPEADGGPPSVWRREDGLVAVFNWTSREREVTLSTNGARRARDLWEDRELDGLDDPWRLTIPPAGVRLIKLSSA